MACGREDVAAISDANNSEDSGPSFVDVGRSENPSKDYDELGDVQIVDCKRGCIRKLDDVEESEDESFEDISDVFGDDWIGKPGVSTSSEDEPTNEPPVLSKKKRVRGRPIPSNITIIQGEITKYKCEICVKTFSSKGHIRYHAYCAQTDKPFKCHLCSKSFSKKNILDYHIKTHTGEKPFTCLMCDRSFLQLDKLKRHKRIHFGNNKECDQCNEKFRDSHSLNVHKRSHSEPNLYVFKCESCSKSFKDKSTLNKHVKGVHSSSKQFFCEHCGKGFDWKYNLVCHVRTHSGVRAYSCSECKRTFKNQNDCYKHRLTHTDEKEYKCTVCEGTFKRRDNLVRHLRNIHPDKDPYKIIKVQTTSKQTSSNDRQTSTFVINKSITNKTKSGDVKSSTDEKCLNVSKKVTKESCKNDPKTPSCHSKIIYNSKIIREPDRISNDYNRTPNESSRTPSDSNKVPNSSNIIFCESNRVPGESERIPSDYSRIPTESSRIPTTSSRILKNYSVIFGDSEPERISHDSVRIPTHRAITEPRRIVENPENVFTNTSRVHFQPGVRSNEQSSYSNSMHDCNRSSVGTDRTNEFNRISYSSNVIIRDSSRNLYESVRIPGESNRIPNEPEVFPLDFDIASDSNRISVIRNLTPSPSNTVPQSSVIKHSGNNSTPRNLLTPSTSRSTPLRARSLTPPSNIRECVIKSTKK